MKKYHIEPITADNRRPGTPQEGWLVYYRPHEAFGWTGRRAFASLPEAEAFAAALTPEGDLAV